MSKFFTYLELANGKNYIKELEGSDVSLDTSNFDNNLSSSDDNVQKALETLDELIVSSGETVNIETLTADKTLTASDATVQIYTSTSNKVINLPTTGLAIGQKFVFINNNAYNSASYFDIRQGVTTLNKLYSENTCTMYWDGTNWDYSQRINVAIGQDSNGSYTGIAIGPYSYGPINGIAIGKSTNGSSYGVAVGYGASGYTNGVAVGYNASSDAYGVGIGYNASGSNTGTAVGFSANGSGNGTAIGYSANTNSKSYNTVALGAYSKAERNRELVSTASDNTTNKAQMTIQKFKETDYDNDSSTPREIFIDASSSRLVLVSNSVYNFFGEFNCYRIVTFDELNFPLGAVKGWQFNGLIKRVGNTTSLVGTPTITLVGSDTDAEISLIDFAIAADDINESLKLTVTIPLGTGGCTYRFSGNIYASETRAN